MSKAKDKKTKENVKAFIDPNKDNLKKRSNIGKQIKNLDIKTKKM